MIFQTRSRKVYTLLKKNERSLSEVLSEVLTQKDYDKVSAMIDYIEMVTTAIPLALDGGLR